MIPHKGYIPKQRKKELGKCHMWWREKKETCISYMSLIWRIYSGVQKNCRSMCIVSRSLSTHRIGRFFWDFSPSWSIYARMQRDCDFSKSAVFSVERHHGSSTTYVFCVPGGHITIPELGQSLSCENCINSEDLCPYYPIKWELASSRIDYRNK